jgi:hypothetical protein
MTSPNVIVDIRYEKMLREVISCPQRAWDRMNFIGIFFEIFGVIFFVIVSLLAFLKRMHFLDFFFHAVPWWCVFVCILGMWMRHKSKSGRMIQSIITAGGGWPQKEMNNAEKEGQTPLNEK